ncbi:MAG: hypothetical protein ABSH48_18330 [Verrucomicrobiota bacterium]
MGDVRDDQPGMVGVLPLNPRGPRLRILIRKIKPFGGTLAIKYVEGILQIGIVSLGRNLVSKDGDRVQIVLRFSERLQLRKLDRIGLRRVADSFNFPTVHVKCGPVGNLKELSLVPFRKKNAFAFIQKIPGFTLIV